MDISDGVHGDDDRGGGFLISQYEALQASKCHCVSCMFQIT